MENKQYKNFSFLAGGRIISAASLAIFFLIFAVLLEPDEYGKMGYLIAFAGTFSILSRFGLPQTVVVYHAKENIPLTHQVNLLAIITISFASIILILINEFAAILCLGLSLSVLFQHNLIGKKRYRDYLKNAILRNSLIFVIPFPLYFIFGINGVLVGLALANILSGMWLIKFTSWKVNWFRLLKNNYKVLINNFGIDVSSNLIRSIDRLLVGAVFGFLSVGLYIFNMQILFALELLPRILYIFLLSEESSGIKNTKIIYLVIIVSGLVSSVMIIFSPYLVEQLFPKFYEDTASLQVLLLSLVPFSISMIITAKMQALESVKVGYSAIVGIGSILILMVILGDIYGLIGLSFAVLISSILNSTFLYFLYKKTLSKQSHDTENANL